MSGAASVVAYSAAWAAFGVATGWLANRAPLRWFEQDTALTRVRSFEYRGRWYDRRFRVSAWKDRLPEAGALFRGGWSKRRLRSLRREDVVRLHQETRRAEWVHWANACFGITFALWTPAPVAAFMVVFGLVVHLPFIVVQRYNRARIEYALATTGAARRRGEPTPEVAPSAPTGPRTPVRRAVRGVIAVAVVSLLLVGVAAIRRDPTRSVTLAEAAERAGLDEPSADEPPSENASSGGAASGRRSGLVPAEGVYEYRGEGTERLGSFTTTQQGPEIPVTVRHRGDGCWSMRADYNSRHWQRLDRCSVDGRLEDRGGETGQTFDLVAVEVSATTETTCERGATAYDPGARPGARTSYQCSARSSAADVPLRSSVTDDVVGRATVEVAGVRRPAVHSRRTREISGAQNGVESSEIWVDAETGLLLRERRTTTMRTDTPIGSLTYEERGSMELVSYPA